jgi:hypothetical protein
MAAQHRLIMLPGFHLASIMDMGPRRVQGGTLSQHPSDELACGALDNAVIESMRTAFAAGMTPTPVLRQIAACRPLPAANANHLGNGAPGLSGYVIAGQTGANRQITAAGRES